MAELESNLKQIDRIVKAFNSEAVTNEDFEKRIERILELVKRLIQNNAEATARAEAKADQALKAVSEQHNLSLSDLKKQTNQLFVGKRLDEISGGTKTQFEELQALLDEKLETIVSGEDGKTPTSDELLTLITPLLPKSPDLSILQKTVKSLQEELKKTKEAFNRFSRSGGGSRFVGPNVNAVNFFDMSTACDGSRKTFVGLPTFRKVLALYCSQFPFLYRPTTDFTLGKNTLTLTDEVAPPERGQSLILTYIK